MNVDYGNIYLNDSEFYDLLLSELDNIDEDDYDFLNPPSDELIYMEENYEPLNLQLLKELRDDTEFVYNYPLVNPMNERGQKPPWKMYRYIIEGGLPYIPISELKYKEFNLLFCEYIYKYGRILDRFGGNFNYPCIIKQHENYLDGEKLIDKDSEIILYEYFGSSLITQPIEIIMETLKRILNNVNNELSTRQRLLLARGVTDINSIFRYMRESNLAENIGRHLQSGRGKKTKKKNRGRKKRK